jgi:AcrR family transcriptional regulator
MPSDGRAELPPWAIGQEHGRHQLPAEVREAHQRERAIAAVARVVHESGEVPSAAQILVAAQMSRPSLYRLFGSKAVLLESACVAATRRLVEPLEATGELEEPWPERLAAAIGALVGAASEEPLIAELCLVHAPFLVGARADTGPRAVRAALLETLAGGRESKDAVEPPARPSAEYFVAGGIVAALEFAVREEQLGDLAGLRAALVGLAAEPFLGREAARALAGTVDGRGATK